MSPRLLPFMLIALGVVASLSGCASSPPAQLIALNEIAPTAAPVRLAGPPVRLGKMRFPGELDQPYLVVKTGSNTRKVSNTVRWVAPVEELIRATLTMDLADRLNSASFLDEASAALDPNARVLLVSIGTFLPDTDHRVQLDARWQLISDTGSLNQSDSLSGHAAIEVAAKGGAAGEIAAAMSKALAQLSTRIVRQLEQNTND